MDHPNTFGDNFRTGSVPTTPVGIPGKTVLAGWISLPQMRRPRVLAYGCWGLMCQGCSRLTSMTAGTIFDRIRVPLRTWFAAVIS